jgi:hypothetical protein
MSNVSPSLQQSSMAEPRFFQPTNVQLHPVFQLLDFLRSSAVDHDEDQNQERTVEEKKDQVISVAEFIFGSTMVAAALALLDNHECFTKISSPHRSLWLIRGSSDLAYVCFACDETPDLFYCNCRSYLEKMTKKPTHEEGLPEMCKHLLALKLIPVLQIGCSHLTVSDKEFAKLVLERSFR